MQPSGFDENVHTTFAVWDPSEGQPKVLASGTHAELIETCPEYVQIYDSQRSTRHYESVHAQ